MVKRETSGRHLQSEVQEAKKHWSLKSDGSQVVCNDIHIEISTNLP